MTQVKSMLLFFGTEWYQSPCGLNRALRLMQRARLVGIPAVKQWRKRASTQRLGYVTNHLERDFSARVANTKWVTDFTYIRTSEGVVDVFGGGDYVITRIVTCTKF